MICIISLTNACNYACKYCAATSCNDWHTNLSKQCSKFGATEIRGCILDMDYLKTWTYSNLPVGSTIVLTGGEPTITPYFISLVKDLEHHYKIIVETNGSKLFKVPNLDIELHIAWHPTMIKFEYFERDLRTFHVRAPKVRIKLVHILGKNDSIKLFDYFEIIENDGTKPLKGVQFFDYMVFVRPNGKVMQCPGAKALQVGDIYNNTLDLSQCKPMDHCSFNCHVFCNSVLHCSGIKPTFEIIPKVLIPSLP